MSSMINNIYNKLQKASDRMDQKTAEKRAARKRFACGPKLNAAFKGVADENAIEQFSHFGTKSLLKMLLQAVDQKMTILRDADLAQPVKNARLLEANNHIAELAAAVGKKGDFSARCKAEDLLEGADEEEAWERQMMTIRTSLAALDARRARVPR